MSSKALEGIKVLDFGWVMVGALTGKHLGDHGAQVIRVESLTRPCPLRGDRQISISTASNPDDKPVFTWQNTSKYSITINLKHPRSREVIDRLIQWADVVNENFTPGTMTKLGLDYEYMCKIKPDIIMTSCSAFGQTGPLAREWGLDGSALTLSGRLYLSGWPDREPVMTTCIPYADVLLPTFATLALIAALDYKRRTGKGQYIDASMIDVCSRSIGSALLDWNANRNLQNRAGNRHPMAAPHGVFPCIGDDRWCAIAVFTEKEWETFCNIIVDPPWTKEPRFSTLQLRKQNEDELEELVAEWTKNHTPEEVMEIMQSSGVPAGVVQNTQDLLEKDPQLKEREFVVPIEHPVLGVFGHIAPAFKLSKNKAELHTSPCLGEHNEYVCTQLLGMSDEEFVGLVQDGLFE